MSYQPPQQPHQPPVVAGYTAQPPNGDWAPPKPKKRATLVLAIVAAALALCVGGVVAFGIVSDDGNGTPAAASTSAAAPAAAAGEKAGSAQETVTGKPGGFCATDQVGKHITADGAQYTCGGPKPYRWLPDHTSAPAAAKPTIKGDDLVHIGEDVPAGTYRAVEAISGDCYWKKSKDAEGDQIIDNDIPAGGRPQVTLKAGQWFTSQGCPDWAKK
jgi:hypothetical protein